MNLTSSPPKAWRLILFLLYKINVAKRSQMQNDQANMSRTVIRILILFLFLFSNGLISFSQKANVVSHDEVLAAMRKASDYMVNTVSCHGGYLWYYKHDLSEQFGEVPARKSQIWVQGGTPEMGHLFLDLYKTTKDESYLTDAKKVANALIYGQHPLGGWHYFIDFDKTGLQKWYADTASQFIVGWEEFRHYYGNCTYDDNVTQGATRYLLRLYIETDDPAYLDPLKKALNFILISQYPNGGWPQRYPLRYEFAHDGLPDYTSFYTLNDGAMNNTIDVLLEAYELLGDERYLEAARRGGDFFMVAQGPVGYAGWTDQYDMNLRPATGRTHEPASLQVRYTLSTIHQLEKLYAYTGDRRYLRPIPLALEWMESVIIGVTDRGLPKYAEWYEPETNFPIRRENVPEVNDDGYMKYKYTIDKKAKFIKFPGKLPERERYEKIRDAEPVKARELYHEMYENRRRRTLDTDGKTIAELIQSMNENGAWIETITVHDISRTMEPNFESVRINGAYNYAVKNIQGISTRTYMRNMRLFMKYLNQ